jgi:hypothetical protein
VLRVDRPFNVWSVDPALAEEPSDWHLLDTTCLKLVDRRETAARRGLSLVPEAARLPRVSRDGRTYTFDVRAEFTRFSTGEAVTAASFARAIARLRDPRMWSRGQPLVEDIVRVRGRGSRLVVTLRRRAGDFLTRMALPFFCAVPADTPTDPDGLERLPSAGPYYVGRWDRNVRLHLRRNPHYRGDRPRRPGQIVVSVRRTPEHDRVTAGAADLATHFPRTEATVANPLARFIPRLAVRYLTFDNRAGKPFANVTLRRAVALGLDRWAVANVRGLRLGHTTNRLLARGVAGFARRSSTPARRTEASLAEARRLARPFLPLTIELAIPNSRPRFEQGELIGRLLRDVGFDVTVLVEPRTADCRGHQRWDVLLTDFSYMSGDPVEVFDRLLAGDERHDCYAKPSGPRLGSVWRRAVEGARQRSGRARAEAFAELDARISRDDVLVAPLHVPNDIVVVSPRLGCFRPHPVYALDLGALCRRR